ncbi:serine hydrolase domain-containing protein [Candidatus Poribacteria bacterium]
MINRLFYVVSILLLVISCCFVQELVTRKADFETFDKEIGVNYFPPPESEDGWRKLEDPGEIQRLAGMDPARLDSLKQWLLDSDNRPFAAVVIRNGYIVLEVERDRSGKTHTGDVKSCAKAICATVLSIASEESQKGNTPQKMTFDDPAFNYIPWAYPLSDPRKKNIKVKQLLNHTSGITPEGYGVRNSVNWGYALGHGGDGKTAKLFFDPGTDLQYSTHGLYHASLVCENVTGKPYDQFAIEYLLKPLGIEQWRFRTLEGGEQHGGNHPSHALGLPAREMARIAYCMLRNGKWGDRQVIPRWFVEETSAPTHSVKGVTEKSFGRDAQSWSHGWELPARMGGEMGRDIPIDARFKPGSGGQLISFVPGLDLVVTRQTGKSGDWQFAEYLRLACAAVLSEDTQ